MRDKDTERRYNQNLMVLFFAMFGIMFGTNGVTVMHLFFLHIFAVCGIAIDGIICWFAKGLAMAMSRVAKHGIAEIASVVLFGTAELVGNLVGSIPGAIAGAITGAVVGFVICKVLCKKPEALEWTKGKEDGMAPWPTT